MSRGADFVAELLEAMPGVEARRAAESVLSRWVGASLYLPRREGRERAIVASLLVRGGLSGADAVRLLSGRADVSESQSRAPKAPKAQRTGCPAAYGICGPLSASPAFSRIKRTSRLDGGKSDDGTT